jgi:hypothetical protein
MASRPDSAATAQPLLLGARVRLHASAATGVIIAHSAIEVDHVRVRWDDTGKETECLRTSGRAMS